MEKFKYIIIFFIFLFLACEKDKNTSKPCNKNRYTFEVSGLISPQKKIYFLGDTLIFISKFSSIQFDFISSQIINYSNSIGVSGQIGFSTFDTLNRNGFADTGIVNINSMFGFFKYIIPNSNIGIWTTYDQVNDSFFVKINLVTQKRGIHSIQVLGLNSNGIKGEDCTNATFNLSLLNSNKNFDLFNYAMGRYPDVYEAPGLYCFRVQ